MHISESKKCYVIPLVDYFYVKTRMLADFQIITVPIIIVQGKPSVTDVYSRVYFVITEIQLSLIQVKPNDSIVSFYSYNNETVMF